MTKVEVIRKLVGIPKSSHYRARARQLLGLLEHYILDKATEGLVIQEAENINGQ